MTSATVPAGCGSTSRQPAARAEDRGAALVALVEDEFGGWLRARRRGRAGGWRHEVHQVLLQGAATPDAEVRGM